MQHPMWTFFLSLLMKGKYDIQKRLVSFISYSSVNNAKEKKTLVPSCVALVHEDWVANKTMSCGCFIMISAEHGSFHPEMS